MLLPTCCCLYGFNNILAATRPHLTTMLLKENPLGMFFFMAAAEVTTANKVSGDNFSMFSAVKYSESVTAVMQMVNAIEHSGSAAGMKPSPSAIQLCITLKIHTSYSYGVPVRLRSDHAQWLQNERPTTNVNSEIVPDHVGQIDGPTEGDLAGVLNGGLPFVDVPRTEEVESSSTTTVVWYRPWSKLRIFCGSTRYA